MFIKRELVRRPAATRASRDCWGAGTRPEDATNLIDTGGARVVALADLFQDQTGQGAGEIQKIQQEKGYATLDRIAAFPWVRMRTGRSLLRRKWTPS